MDGSLFLKADYLGTSPGQNVQGINPVLLCPLHRCLQRYGRNKARFENVLREAFGEEISIGRTKIEFNVERASRFRL